MKYCVPTVRADDRGGDDARGTAVEKLKIQQFLAIPLAGKVVAPCPAMAMPLFLFERGIEPRSRTRWSAVRVASVGNSVLTSPRGLRLPLLHSTTLEVHVPALKCRNLERFRC